MDSKKLNALLSRLRNDPDEAEWVEFKLNNSKPEDIGEYLSALSNAARLHDQPMAYFVWGVKNDANDLVGTAFTPKKQKVGNEELENWLVRLLEPRLDLWRALAPRSFQFCLKAWQLITHTPASPTYRKLKSKLSAAEHDLVRSFRPTEQVALAWERTAGAIQVSLGTPGRLALRSRCGDM
jgi:hypothetical protein